MSPASFRSLKNKNYKIYFFTQFISLTGSWAQSVAQNWLCYKLTGSPIMLGSLVFFEQIPTFFLIPFTGPLCDSHSLKKIIFLSHVVLFLNAGLLSFFALTGQIQVGHLFFFAVLNGIANAFNLPAKTSFLGDLVEKHHLSNAIALNASVFNLARVIGPSIAGLTIYHFGANICFLLNALSFIPFLFGLSKIRTIRPVAFTSVKGFINAYREPIGYIRKNMFLKNTFFLVYASCFFGYSYLVMMPVFCQDIFHGNAKLLGLLVSFVGVGAVVGSLTLASKQNTIGLEETLIRSCIGFAISTMLFALSTNLPVSLGLLLVIGFFMVKQMAIANTLVQIQLDTKLRGRIMSLYVLAHVGMAPVGAYFSGKIGALIGVPLTISFCGFLNLLVALWFAKASMTHRFTHEELSQEELTQAA